MRILFLSAEAAPFVKVGGLGDVAGSLPAALRQLGVDIRLALPLHARIDRAAHDLQPLLELKVESAHGDVPARVYFTQKYGVPTYLIDSPLIPPGQSIYAAHGADGHKYVHFCLAALTLARRLNWQPHLLHAQDWHTAPAIYALSRLRGEPFFSRAASLLTIHNLPYMGGGAEQALWDFGLPPAHHTPLPWWLQHNPLALGLLTADHLNTVSPGYAEEMLTPDFGAGVDGFLRDHRRFDLTGILNGLDTDSWNPAADRALRFNYSADDLTPKAGNKLALQEELALPRGGGRVPLFAIVSRMDFQKGLDIAIEGFRQLGIPGWQAVILGTGHPHYENAARSLAAEFPGQVRARIAFDSALGRRIYAGADAFLIPSRYEPCGLTQMISMRYGTVPIARAVGGLRDTITPHPHPASTGILFGYPTADAMAGTLRYAIALYQDEAAWRGMQLRGMAQDFSWDAPARQYHHLYRRLISRRMG
jgi:starch synthase